MPELRSMIANFIAGRKQPQETVRYELVNASTGSFTPWSGKVYENDIARSAIWTIAEAAGKARFLHVRGDGQEMRLFPDAIIRATLEQPNEYLTMQDLISKMVTHLEIYNNAFALICRDQRGRPVSIYPLDYSSVELRESKDHEMYCRFRFRGIRNIEVSYSDVIHLRKHFNADEFYGESNKAALTNLMDIVCASDQSIVNAVKNSALISWLLKFKQTLKPEDIKKQVKEFSESYLRTSENQWAAAPTDPRYDAEQVKHESFVPNAPQMDKAKLRIYSYYGVNDAIVQKTYNEDQWNAWYEGKIEPILMQFAAQMTMKFFSTKERAFRNRVMPESAALQYASTATKLNLVSMVDRGALLPNEWRAALNLSPIEGGDKPLRRLDTQTVGQADKETKPAAPADDGNSQPIANLENQQGDKPKDKQKEGATMNENENRDREQPETARHDWAFEMRSAEMPTEGDQQHGATVEGRAITYDSPTVMFEDEGVKYYEVIERGALDGADMSDVPMRYNHSKSFMIVARHNTARPNRSNMDFVIDDAGLLIRADLSKTESGRQLHEAIEAGLVDKMSFSFTVAEERYDNLTHTRYITKIKKLWDVAAVDTPAYDTTSIYARDRFQAEAESAKKAAEAAERSKRQLALEIDTLTTIYGG